MTSAADTTTSSIPETLISVTQKTESTVITSDTTTTVTAVLKGDANGDGVVSVEDAQLALLDYVDTLAGLQSSLTDKQKEACDINGDNQITVEDAQLILLYYVSNTLTGEIVTWDELLGKAKPVNPRPIIMQIKESFFDDKEETEV